MKFSRRTALTGLAASGAMAALGSPPLRAEKDLEMGDNGLHIQKWFMESFLDMAEDHAELAEQDKHLAVLFEQRGCPYCRELHRVNFAREEIITYLNKNFGVVQLDLWGSRGATDFDGKEMEERKLAIRWRAIFTPTMVFFPKDSGLVKGKKGVDSEIFRMPGYFKPFHFMSMLEFVNEGLYRTGSFQGYLQDKFAELRKKGIDPEVW